METKRKARYVFGPVPSRRLGRSLGIDLVPRKTCSYDCVYCQLGRTTNRTVDRGPYVSTESVLRELEDHLSAAPPPDYITLSGSGEPTLQVGLGALLKGIKRLTNRPIAVLTNGALLWRTDVQIELQEAQLVIPSLDAGDEETFQQVNRPHPGLRFHQVVDGIADFRKHFRGQMWLEVFLLAGLTDQDAQLTRIRAAAKRIGPDRIQVNTVARPPSQAWARAVGARELLQAARRLEAEVVTDLCSDDVVAGDALSSGQILSLLRRRPCTLEDLASGLVAHRLQVAKQIEHLVRDGSVSIRRHAERTYYQPAR